MGKFNHPKFARFFCANLGFDTPNFIKILGEGSGICREPVKRVDTIVESCNVTKIIEIMCMYVYTHIYIYILDVPNKTSIDREWLQWFAHDNGLFNPQVTHTICVHC